MNRTLGAVTRLARELGGLFFDDGSLAIAVLLILAGTALFASTPWFDPPAAMAFLVGAVIVALLENVLRTARESRPS